MHYYQFNISDYQSHTRHLTPIEDICYRRILDWLYLHEKPLPLDPLKVARIIVLNDCLTDVERVLNEFLTKTEHGWVSVRVLSEIEIYNEKLEKASKAGKASAEARKTKIKQSLKSSEHLFNERSTGVQPTINHKPLTNNQLNTLVHSDAVDDCPHQKIIDLYHEKLPMLTMVKVWNDKRRNQLKSRWREDKKRQNLDYWSRLFDYIAESDLLTGRAGDWKADLEWITKSQNFVKIIEGKYVNRNAS